VKFTCDSTIEETTEANFRLAEMVGTVRKMLWTGLLLAPLVFLFTYFVLDRSTYGLVLGTGATLAFAVYIFLNHKNMCRKQFRKMLVKSMGTDQPVPSEFELTDEKVTVRRQGQEFTSGWEGIVRLEEREDALELIMEPLGIIRIPKRVFSDPEELAALRGYMEERIGGRGPVSPS
jgi:hypothetical protein